MEPFAKAAGPVPHVHDRSDCGARLMVWPDPKGANNDCVWRVPGDISLEQAIVSSRQHAAADPGAPWRWSILEAHEA